MMDRNTSESLHQPLDFQHKPFRPSYVASTMPFKLDEGYSDETGSQAEAEAAQLTEARLAVPASIMALSEADRSGTS